MESSLEARKRKHSCNLASQSSQNNVDKLYKIYEKINSSPEKATLEEDFRQLLQIVHNGDKEKSLAAQFVTRFAEHFPQLDVQVANALFDLCEEDDIVIRRQAEKDLVTVCEKLPNLVPTVADVFAQIMQTSSVSELTTVQANLMSLFNYNPEGTLAGIFAQIRTGEPLAQDRCFKFLESNYKSLCLQFMTSSFENCVWEQVRHAVKFVDSNSQCVTIMDMLNSTKKVKTGQGRKELVELIEIMLARDRALKKFETEDVARFTILADFAFPYFDETITSANMFALFCTSVLPGIEVSDPKTESIYFHVLRLTLELSEYTGAMTQGKTETCLSSLLQEADKFLHHVPESLPFIAATPPEYNFSFLESLFYMSHNLIRAHPDLLDKTVRACEGLLPKIAYLLQAVIPYQNRLRSDLQRFSMKEIRGQVDKVKCLRSLANIALIGKIFYSGKPTDAKIRLSWMVTALTASTSSYASPRIGSARDKKIIRVPRTRFGDEGRRSQEDRGIYHPPGGKYSARMCQSGGRGLVTRSFKRKRLDDRDLRSRLGRRY